MQDATNATESTLAPSDPPSDPSTPGDNNMLASVLMIGGLSLAIFILLRRLYRRSSIARSSQALTSKEKIESIRVSATVPRQEGDRYMAEAEELTRRLAAILDNKAARLEILIDDAEVKIAQLESMGIAQDPASDSQGLVGETPRMTGRARMNPTHLDRARLDLLTLERNGGEGTSPPESDAEPAVAPPPTPPTAEELLQLVYDHADTGLSALEIARKLEQPLGQVELMLNLRRQTG